MHVTIPLNTMTVPEKLRALEDIWDDLCRTADVIPSPDWHADVLQAREQKVRAGEAKFVGLDEAKELMRMRYGSEQYCTAGETRHGSAPN